jgi:hypothetical protein
MEDFVEIIDERLETLCEEFTELEEPEKDYLLDITQALAHFVFVKNDNAHKEPTPQANTY